MEPYDIGYAIGSILPFLFFAAGFIIFIVLMIRRSKEREKENFEDRNN